MSALSHPVIIEMNAKKKCKLMRLKERWRASEREREREGER